MIDVCDGCAQVIEDKAKRPSALGIATSDICANDGRRRALLLGVSALTIYAARMTS